MSVIITATCWVFFPCLSLLLMLSADIWVWNTFKTSQVKAAGLDRKWCFSHGRQWKTVSLFSSCKQQRNFKCLSFAGQSWTSGVLNLNKSQLVCLIRAGSVPFYCLGLGSVCHVPRMDLSWLAISSNHVVWHNYFKWKMFFFEADGEFELWSAGKKSIVALFYHGCLLIGASWCSLFIWVLDRVLLSSDFYWDVFF